MSSSSGNRNLNSGSGPEDDGQHPTSPDSTRLSPDFENGKSGAESAGQELDQRPDPTSRLQIAKIPQVPAGPEIKACVREMGGPEYQPEHAVEGIRELVADLVYRGVYTMGTSTGRERLVELIPASDPGGNPDVTIRAIDSHLALKDLLVRNRAKLTAFVPVGIPEVEEAEIEVEMGFPAGALQTCISAGYWPDVPNLAGKARMPFLRPDGSAVKVPGYDSWTEYFVLPPLISRPDDPVITVLVDMAHQGWRGTMGDLAEEIKRRAGLELTPHKISRLMRSGEGKAALAQADIAFGPTGSKPGRGGTEYSLTVMTGSNKAIESSQTNAKRSFDLSMDQTGSSQDPVPDFPDSKSGSRVSDGKALSTRETRPDFPVSKSGQSRVKPGKVGTPMPS